MAEERPVAGIDGDLVVAALVARDGAGRHAEALRRRPAVAGHRPRAAAAVAQPQLEAMPTRRLRREGAVGGCVPGGVVEDLRAADEESDAVVDVLGESRGACQIDLAGIDPGRVDAVVPDAVGGGVIVRGRVRAEIDVRLGRIVRHVEGSAHLAANEARLPRRRRRRRHAGHCRRRDHGTDAGETLHNCSLTLRIRDSVSACLLGVAGSRAVQGSRERVFRFPRTPLSATSP